MTADAAQKPLIFISRAGEDAALAATLARILRDAGYETIEQSEDFGAAAFLHRMHKAIESGARVVGLMSDAWLRKDHCEAEWQAAIAGDPLNKHERLVVFRVSDCQPVGLLRNFAYCDLVPLRGDDAALADLAPLALSGALRRDRALAARHWREPVTIIDGQHFKDDPGFTGRENEMAALEAALFGGGGEALVHPVAAHGLGGVGKSALAKAWGWLQRDRYSAVWWLDASSEGGIIDGLLRYGARVDPLVAAIEDKEKAAAFVRDTYLRGLPKPVLVVFDNVDDEKLFARWRPGVEAPVQGDCTHVLVTSRLRAFRAGIRTVPVGLFSEGESLAYLRANAGRDDIADADFAAIAEDLGHLPLALSHAAAVLRDSPFTAAAAYRARIGEHMRNAPDNADYDRAVYATFIEALGQAEARCPGARTVMAAAACCAPSGVPVWLMDGLATMALPEGATQPAMVADAINALARTSLITAAPGAAAFDMHRLVQAAVRDSLGADLPAWQGVVTGLAVRQMPEGAASRPGVRERCAALAPHLIELSGAYAENTLRYCLIGSGDALMVLGFSARANEVVAAAVSVAERLAKADPANAGYQRDLSVSYNKMGDLAVAAGDGAAARDWFAKDLEVAERLAKADPDNTGYQHDLSVSYERMGDLAVTAGDGAAARDWSTKALEVRERLAKADPANAGYQRDLSVSYNKMGDLAVAAGDGAAARDWFTKGLDVAERLAKADPDNAGYQRDLSISYNKMGDLAVAAGDGAAARDWFTKALEVRERLAKADPDNAGYQRDLSVSYSKMGDLAAAARDGAAARDWFAKALEVRERLAKADPDNAEYQRALIISHVKLAGLGDGAAAHYRAALNIAETLASTGRLAGRDAWMVEELRRRLNAAGG